MRIQLGSLQGTDSELRLPVEDDGPDKHLHLTRVTALSGLLEKDAQGLRMTDARANELDLGAAHWIFGSVELVSPEPSSFKHARLDMTVSDEPLDLDLTVDVVDFQRLIIVAGDTRVSGVARMENASLRLKQGQGTIRAEAAHITDLEVQLGALTLRVPELQVSGFMVGWGDPDGFRMAAHTALGKTVGVEHAAAHATATGVDMRGFEVHHGGVYALSIEAEGLKSRVDFPEPAPLEDAPKPPRQQPERPTLDLDVLDALGGKLFARVKLDVRLPGGLRRKLTIPLDLEVVEGSIDYRALEHSLPMFEDSLLDFSRDGDWLVLELGLPVLPTRGLGKQLLRWPLRSSDGTTKKGHQVRLAALPRFEPPGGRKPTEAEPEPSKPSRVRLEKAAADIGPMQLRMAPPAQHLDAAVEYLAFEQAELEGQLEHLHDGAPPGQIAARLKGLESRLDELPAGEKCLDLGITARRIPELRVHTAGFRARELDLEAEGVSLKSVRYR